MSLGKVDIPAQRARIERLRRSPDVSEGYLVLVSLEQAIDEIERLRKVVDAAGALHSELRRSNPPTHFMAWYLLNDALAVLETP